MSRRTEILEIPFDKALQRMERGEIKDGKTIMLIQYAKLKNLQ
jgi:GDP-mannose pyrophosphatase NudK